MMNSFLEAGLRFAATKNRKDAAATTRIHNCDWAGRVVGEKVPRQAVDESRPRQALSWISNGPFSLRKDVMFSLEVVTIILLGRALRDTEKYVKARGEPLRHCHPGRTILQWSTPSCGLK